MIELRHFTNVWTPFCPVFYRSATSPFFMTRVLAIRKEAASSRPHSGKRIFRAVSTVFSMAATRLNVN
jgi:hypothetical protein